MIIGFSGTMGSGKSTAIESLMFRYPRKVTLIKFAGPLYDMQDYVYRRISSVYSRPDNFVKDRKLLQWIGTEWGRDSISKTIWVDIWKSEAVSAVAENKIVVCDDVRFDNEAETIKQLGGKIVKIIASNSNTRTVQGYAQHASEAGIAENLVDFVVENNGTKFEYQNKLNELYNKLFDANFGSKQSGGDA